MPFDGNEEDHEVLNDVKIRSSEERMKTREVVLRPELLAAFRYVRQRIDHPDHWCQGALHQDDHHTGKVLRVCLAGAFLEAQGEDVRASKGYEGPLWTDFNDTLLRFAGDGRYRYGTAINFNDHRETKLVDVHRALDGAIAKLEAERIKLPIIAPIERWWRRSRAEARLGLKVDG